MYFRAAFFCGLLLAGPVPAGAVPVTGLYEAEVPVPDQSEAARRAGIKEALAAVLVKLTGDSGIAARPELGEFLAQALQYAQQYRYVQQGPAAAGPAAAPPRLYLWARFDAAIVDDALHRAGIPVWGRERPTTLVWLAVDGPGGAQLAGPGQDSAYYLGSLERHAFRRGLPLLFPLLDLEDAATLSAADVLAGRLEPLRQASARYPGDAVLAGGLREVRPGQWEANWMALIDGEPVTWTSQGTDAELSLAAGLDGMADRLARRYVASAQSGDPVAVTLLVSEVFSLDQYARVLEYLGSLSPVRSVQIVQVEPGRVTYEVSALGGAQALGQAIGFGRVMQAEPATAGATGLAYRLLP